jgi:hypothetical protein
MLFGKEVFGFAKQLLNSPENDHLNVVWQFFNHCDYAFIEID